MKKLLLAFLFSLLFLSIEIKVLWLPIPEKTKNLSLRLKSSIFWISGLLIKDKTNKKAKKVAGNKKNNVRIFFRILKLIIG